jgi:hypothetical protein
MHPLLQFSIPLRELLLNLLPVRHIAEKDRYAAAVGIHPMFEPPLRRFMK